MGLAPGMSLGPNREEPHHAQLERHVRASYGKGKIEYTAHDAPVEQQSTYLRLAFFPKTAVRGDEKPLQDDAKPF